MDLRNLIKQGEKLLKDNSQSILTALGITGTITTAYLAGKASWEGGQMVANHEQMVGTSSDRKKRIKERAQLVWKLYIPAGISGAVTIGCVIGATRVGSRRTAAVTAAYTISEKAFSEYRDKVVEKFGEGKERSVRDDLAQDRVTRNSSGSKEVLVTGSGNVLCYESFTGRYFNSDMETLRRAENNVNAKLVGSMYVYLSDFYDFIGLPYTSVSNHIGWEAGKLMELRFSTVLSEDGRPCISFEYNYTKPL
jgi:Family of unknown function (DUF6353)